jgi:hypothetical protein
MHLSTPSLMLLMEQSADHNETAEILGELKNRPDVFNLERVLALVTNSSRPEAVRRAAVICSMTINPDKAIGWMREQAQDKYLAPHFRKLAVQGLTWAMSPGQTLHVLEAIAARSDLAVVRVAAIQQVAVFRNVRSVGLLFSLTRDSDNNIAEAAQVALDVVVKHQGGLAGVLEKLKERAAEFTSQGRTKAALEVLQTAAQLSPSDGSVQAGIRRLRTAA